MQANAIAAGVNVRFLHIAALAIPAGQVGQAYDHTLQAAQQQVAMNNIDVGGPLTGAFFNGISLSVPQNANAYDYQAAWSSLPVPPNGLQLTNAGRLHGTPTAAGATNMTIRAEAQDKNHLFNTRALTMTINP